MKSILSRIFVHIHLYTTLKFSINFRHQPKHFKIGIDKNGVQRMLEEMLSMTAMKAVCERYFRICSTIVKKPNITTMNAETVNDIAFLTYYKIPLCNLVQGKDMCFQFELCVYKIFLLIFGKG